MPLYVTEYPSSAVHQGTGVPIAFVPVTGPIAEQKIAIGGASVAGVAFNTKTKVIRIETDAICSIAFGPVATVTATTSNARMFTNHTEYFAVQPDGNMTLAAIAHA